LSRSDKESERALDRVVPHLSSLIGRPKVPREHLFALAAAVAGQRCLVTGAGGSIGSSLSRLLAVQPHNRLVFVDSHENSLFQLESRLTEAGSASDSMRFVLLDIRDKEAVGRLLEIERPQTIFHLAAYKHVPLAEQCPLPYLDVNVLAGWQLLELAAMHRVERLVFSSTDKAVNPTNVYGATKRAMELAMRAHANASPQTKLVSARLVNVVGARGSVIETFVRQICEGKPLTVTDPAMTRYWITEEEALLLLLTAATSPRESTVVTLDLSAPCTVLSVAERLWELLRSGQTPMPLRTVGLRPGEKLSEELLYASERLVPTDAMWVVEVANDREQRPSLAEMAAWVEGLRRAVRQSQVEEAVASLFSFVRDFS